MTPLQNTLDFIAGKRVERIPFHPLVMQYAAKMTGIPFGKYCTDYYYQFSAMIGFAEKYGMDYIHPSGFPYCEAIAYGLNVSFPEDDLPQARDHLIKDFERDRHLIRKMDLERNPSVINRIKALDLYMSKFGDKYFIAGHIEGPFAEYADLRGFSDACMDLYDYPDEIMEVFAKITENSREFIKLQAATGIHCIDIGDSVSSQISTAMYREFVMPFHKEIVEYAHSLGLLVKFHICGNITPIVLDLISIGIDIIDCDYLVQDWDRFIPMLGKNQVFCGNIDPVGVIRNGNPELIEREVNKLLSQTRNKLILASGCEVPKDTPLENYMALYNASRKYKMCNN